MHNELSEYSTQDLLDLTTNKDGDVAYRASWTLFNRWESGVDVSFLIDFIDTEVVSDRLRGTYYLFEAAPRVDSVKNAVLKLADDVLAQCRRAFVGYLLDSGWYDDAAAVGLVNCIQDFDIRVRLKVIDWAIATTEARFEDFSRRVMADSTLVSNSARVSSTDKWRTLIKRRGVRALGIARRVRGGESVAQIRATIVEEDGFTFDHLAAFESHYKRQREHRQTLRHPHSKAGFD